MKIPVSLVVLLSIAALVFAWVIFPDLMTENRVMKLCKEHAPTTNSTVILEYSDCPIGELPYGGTHLRNIRNANGEVDRTVSLEPIGYKYDTFSGTSLHGHAFIGVYPQVQQITAIFITRDEELGEYVIGFNNDQEVIHRSEPNFTACNNDGETVQCVSVVSEFNEFYDDYDALVWAMAFMP